MLAIWAGMSLFEGVDLGGAGHSTSPGYDEYKARKIKMEKMEQSQSKFRICLQKHEEGRDYHKKLNNSIITRFITTCIIWWTGKRGDAVWNGLARYYRIAAMNGDYKANIRLQYLLKADVSVPIYLKRKYIISTRNWQNNCRQRLTIICMVYLDVGYGVRTEKDGKYAYQERLQTWGSREAQYVVSEMLGDINDEETLQMRLQINRAVTLLCL